MKWTSLFAVSFLLIVSCATAPVETVAPGEEETFPYAPEKMFANLKTSLVELGFQPTTIDEQKMEIVVKLAELSDRQRSTYMNCLATEAAGTRYIVPETQTACTITVSGTPAESKVMVTVQFKGRKVSAETGENLGWFKCESTKQMEREIFRQLWKSVGGKRT